MIGQRERVATAIKTCRDAGFTHISMFIDPDPRQVQASAELGATAIELHTGRYADAKTDHSLQVELEALRSAGLATVEAGLHLHAGHGLNYRNVAPVATIAHMEELNIGHSIISRAVLVGLERAVGEMKALMRESVRGSLV